MFLLKPHLKPPRKRYAQAQDLNEPITELKVWVRVCLFSMYSRITQRLCKKTLSAGRPDPKDAEHSLVLFDFSAGSPDRDSDRFSKVWGELNDVIMGGRALPYATPPLSQLNL